MAEHQDLAAAQDQPAIRPVRPFATLHEDVFRVIAKAPLLFIVLPVLALFPFDLLIEAATAHQAQDTWGQLRTSWRLRQMVDLVIGMWITAAQLHGLKELAEGRVPTVGRSLCEGLGLWGRLLGVWFVAGLRILAGLVFFILPGIYFAMKYALISPVVIFEDKRGAAALARSERYVAGCTWRVGLSIAGFWLLYLPLSLAPSVLAPRGSPVLHGALATMPMNLLMSFLTIVVTLLYAERRGADPSTGWRAGSAPGHGPGGG